MRIAPRSGDAANHPTTFSTIFGKRCRAAERGQPLGCTIIGWSQQEGQPNATMQRKARRAGHHHPDCFAQGLVRRHVEIGNRRWPVAISHSLCLLPRSSVLGGPIVSGPERVSQPLAQAHRGWGRSVRFDAAGYAGHPKVAPRDGSFIYLAA